MKYKVDHDMHIHSIISACSNDPEQTTDDILRYAEKNNFTTICVTDHFYDADAGSDFVWHKTQVFENVIKSRPLPQKEGIQFLFGCETDLDMNLVLGITEKRFDEFDFIIIPTTHMHINGYTVRGDETPEERALIWAKRLDAVLNMDLPFEKIGIAHLTTTKIASGDYLEVLRLIPDSEYHRLFALASKRGVGIELNFNSLAFESDEERELVLKPYKIAKQEGCKFYFGGDAHHPQHFIHTRENFENIVDLLELTEEDRFILK